MLTLGVTGGIGSGKTALVRHLAEKPGVRAILADDLAKRLMVEDGAVRAALVDRFGPEVYAADGSLDRAALAARVFSDPAELAALNAIVHPAVRRALVEAQAAARADGVRLLVYEAALLVETGGAKVVDHVAVVDAPVETRVERAMARDGATREAVLARLSKQIDPAEARAAADTVVENGGTLAELRAQADALYERLVAGSPG